MRLNVWQALRSCVAEIVVKSEPRGIAIRGSSLFVDQLVARTAFQVVALPQLVVEDSISLTVFQPPSLVYPSQAAPSSV